MMSLKTQPRIVDTLILLTCLFVFAQILFCFAFVQASGSTSVIAHYLMKYVFTSKIAIFGLIQFVAGQALLYTLWIWFVWYLTTSNSELFSLSSRKKYLVGVFIWMISLVAIITANTYYVPYSIFAELVRHDLLNNYLSFDQIKLILNFVVIILFCFMLTSAINLCRSVFKKRNLLRHGFILLFGLIIAISFAAPGTNFKSKFIASTDKPNVIIIGLDALRPDFTGFYNPQMHTPQIDAFLKSANVFSNAYTPLSRTFPSWVGILTSTYPAHNNARENNSDLTFLNMDETLAKSLKQAGYETWYATDDSRFNNINPLFGFDQVIGTPMGVNDFLIGSLNDFPLSNLFISTRLGKFLFPYNYANHSATFGYDPDNFLDVLANHLQQREQRPLFMAVHFTVSGWPFYYMGDRKMADSRNLARYINSVEEGDKQLTKFMNFLSENELLTNSIVVLLSDHGITHGLPGDRVVNKKNYQGNADNIHKLKIERYHFASHASFDFQNDYGIDTSYGYGGDLLSLKQNHSLLAIRGYGIDVGKGQQIEPRVSLLDITPTLLDILHLPSIKNSDGISLKPLLLNSNNNSLANRPFYFETGFTIPEINKEDISAEKVFSEAEQFYQVDPDTGLVFMSHTAQNNMLKQKQYAILQGDWLLVSFPSSVAYKLAPTNNANQMKFVEYNVPPFMVLVNIKTGKWTTELNTAFASSAPVESLLLKLNKFYENNLIFSRHP